MDIGSILLILAVLVPVVLYISRPFMERSATEVTHEEHNFSALLAERDRLVNAIKELDFDHRMGKIPEDDYQIQRASLMRMGADVLRKIDQYGGASEGSEVADRIETDIEAGEPERKNAVSDSNDELETLIANRRRLQKENDQPKTGGFCPQCGNCVQEGDMFCPKCGNTLS